jgi:preprotein translocase subunit SecF
MNIIKFRPLFFFISLLLLTTCLLSIFFWGFKPSIDFIGGSTWELNLLSKPSTSQIEEIFRKNNIDGVIVTSTDTKYHLEFRNVNPDQKNILNEEIEKIDPEYEELKFETLGPTLGKELFNKTIFAIVLSCTTLLLFISYRFKDFHFGLSAIIALFHDSFILIGSFSVLGHFFGAELNSLFVTALLTTLSLSVYDTVVIFDRMRELKIKYYGNTLKEIANKSVVESLSRSINTSVTTAIPLISLVVLGGDTTRWFAAALLIGVISGTYSSIGVAIPLVLFFKKNRKKK